MKTYKRLYEQLCSIDNLRQAHEKAKRGKSRKDSVIEFTKNLDINLRILHEQLSNQTYKPRPLRKFVIRDPKTRTIHASDFRDRVVHHALVNVLEPIFEKLFIHDSFASRKKKGTLPAVLRFETFLRRVTHNGKQVENAYDDNGIVGYVFKADIRHFFDTVNHDILLSIINSKIKDERVMWLVKKILDNFDVDIAGTGMPLGNYTSQFFANIYLTRLDYFAKHVLKSEYYIRYVDDLVILHRNKAFLEECQRKINIYLKHLKVELHPDKSDIIPLQKGVPFLGYRIFFSHRLLRKRNLRQFMKRFEEYSELYKSGALNEKDFMNRLTGWFGYAQWAKTYKLRQQLLGRIHKSGGGGERRN